MQGPLQRRTEGPLPQPERPYVTVGVTFQLELGLQVEEESEEEQPPANIVVDVSGSPSDVSGNANGEIGIEVQSLVPKDDKDTIVSL